MNLRFTRLTLLISAVALGCFMAYASKREAVRLGVDDQIRLLNAQVVNVVIDRQTIRERLLAMIEKPLIAYVLFGAGTIFICLELKHAGAAIPGAIGTLATILALYGFYLAGTNPLGVALLLLALLLFFFGASRHGIGFLSLGGIVAAVIGSLILVRVAAPELESPPGIVLGVAITVSLTIVILFRLGFKSRDAKLGVSEQSIIGMTGCAETDFQLEGFVFVRGELWKARARASISKGSRVRVAGLNGPVLEIEPLQK